MDTPVDLRQRLLGLYQKVHALLAYVLYVRQMYFLLIHNSSHIKNNNSM